MLHKVKKAIDDLACDGNKPDIGVVIEDIEKCLSKMEELRVCGKASLDILLGCILVLETIIGKGEDNDG